MMFFERTDQKETEGSLEKQRLGTIFGGGKGISSLVLVKF
ncbi:unnamed protein product [Gulo gulo]|uniref:Uncharacterized protein n=1 Tax=Gulo gulo TaxID=48420 RepID=A0A9X9Q9M1_GULGU|nr:unnamed protein product [Gulo gulo]